MWVVILCTYFTSRQLSLLLCTFCLVYVCFSMEELKLGKILEDVTKLLPSLPGGEETQVRSRGPWFEFYTGLT